MKRTDEDVVLDTHDHTCVPRAPVTTDSRHSHYLINCTFSLVEIIRKYRTNVDIHTQRDATLSAAVNHSHVGGYHMTEQFPSDEWFEELADRLNANETYREQADGYGVDENGDYVFTIEAGDGLEETYHYYIGLEDGKCTGTHRVESLADTDNGFQLSGPYSNWKELVRGEMGAIEGIMGGDFELDGSMNYLLKYQDAARTFVETCSEIDTEFI